MSINSMNINGTNNILSIRHIIGMISAVSAGSVSPNISTAGLGGRAIYIYIYIYIYLYIYTYVYTYIYIYICV